LYVQIICGYYSSSSDTEHSVAAAEVKDDTSKVRVSITRGHKHSDKSIGQVGARNLQDTGPPGAGLDTPWLD